MKGMELARSYYEQYGDQIRGMFPQYADRMAFGLVGEGTHERFVIQYEKFMKKANEKLTAQH